MGQYLGEVVGEVQDVLHKVPTDGEGRIIRNRRNAVKTKLTKKMKKRGTYEVGIWKSGMARL